MLAIRVTALAILMTSPLSSAEALEWPSQLNKSLADLESELSKTAVCERGGFSTSLNYVDLSTSVRPDLFSPVVTDSYKYAVISNDTKDLSFDRDDQRRHFDKNIHTLHCTIGREASVTAYEFNNEIFRIHINFDRCKSRNEHTPLFNLSDINAFTYLACEGIDLSQKPFDIAILKTIKDSNNYFYNSKNLGFLHSIWNHIHVAQYSENEVKIINGANCSLRTKDRYNTFNEITPYKCITDIQNSDATRWSATTMYEFFTPGILYDQTKYYLTSNRIYINFPLQEVAVDSMVDGLNTQINAIKFEIRERMSNKEITEKTTSDILSGH